MKIIHVPNLDGRLPSRIAKVDRHSTLRSGRLVGGLAGTLETASLVATILHSSWNLLVEGGEDREAQEDGDNVNELEGCARLGDDAPEGDGDELEGDDAQGGADKTLPTVPISLSIVYWRIFLKFPAARPILQTIGFTDHQLHNLD